MTQQTAVDYLIKQISEILGPLKTEAMTDLLLVDAIQKAKQMEKERHDKWNEFLNAEKTLGVSDVKTIERIQWYYNQYYNETYGKG